MSDKLKRKAATQLRKTSIDSSSTLNQNHGNLFFLIFFVKSHKYAIVDRSEIYLDEDDEEMGRVSHLGRLFEVKIIKKGKIK